MRSDPITSGLFSRNRSRLVRLLPECSVAVLCSNPRMLRNGDQFYPYRQHSDFFYLTGIAQPESILVLSAEGATLFISKPDPKTILWSGPLLSLEDAALLSGILAIRWLDQLDLFLEEEVFPARRVFINQLPDTRICEKAITFPPHLERSSLEALMTSLRMIKEPEELEEMKKASAITHSAFLRVVNTLKPGMREFEVEAELSAEFTRRGAWGHAFEPILASGPNALVLHYVGNSGCCREGDLLLMDFGAEVNNYAADCSRTLPVGGKFTKRQRELYDAVYRVFIEARDLMVPGIGIGEFHRRVGELWEEQHIALGLYTRDEARKRNGSDRLWKKYFPHGTSHSLGMDVHDPFDRSEPFAPGMVMTCEPGIYVQEEGIGIRLENDILITENGPVDLMGDIPIEAGEIEELMHSNRILR
ncbi:MAG: M24 family metallopeptidase [Bacteroidetes bacterium]|nr:M24 family metallopeptidase [Bacteroidota bacterium]